MTAIKGIDVSVWQGDIAWERVKADGVGFAMIRAGCGLSPDPTFIRNMQGAAAQGIPCGVYLYSRAVTEGEALQEAVFLQKAAAPYRVLYPAAIDIEGAAQHALTAARRTALATAFCGAMAGAGYTPAVYSSLSWFQGLFDLPGLSPHALWVADWSSEKPVLADGPDIWQRSSRGRVEGIATVVDLDISYRDFAAENGGATPEPPAQEAPAAGTALMLYGVPLYASATAESRSATISGRYWVYDGVVIDGRLRITNSADRVEKAPAAQNVR